MQASMKISWASLSALLGGSSLHAFIDGSNAILLNNWVWQAQHKTEVHYATRSARTNVHATWLSAPGVTLVPTCVFATWPSVHRVDARQVRLYLCKAPQSHNGPPSRNTESSQKGSRLAGVAPKYQLLNHVPKCGREMAGQGRPEERSVPPPRGGCDRLTETPVQRNGRAKPPRGGKVPVCSVATWSAWTRRVHRIHGVCWVITL